MSNQNTEKQSVGRRPTGKRRGRRAVLVGSSGELRELSRELSRKPSALAIVGVFCNDGVWQAPDGLTLLGSCDELLDWLGTGDQTDEVYFLTGSMSRSQTLSLYGLCQRTGVRCVAVPPGLSALRRRMEVSQVGDALLLSLRDEPLSHWYNRLLKRCIDLLVSGLVLLTIFPILYVVVLIAIKWKSPGPVFLRQKRCGQDGRPFNLLTFRTRHLPSQVGEEKAVRDFTFGNLLYRSRANVLPQLLNVWTGKLSLVGPRPLIPQQAEDYLKLLHRYLERWPLKAGMTGWAQQQGFGDEAGNDERLEQRVREDIWYGEHWTACLDCRIILRSLVKPNKIKR